MRYTNNKPSLLTRVRQSFSVLKRGYEGAKTTILNMGLRSDNRTGDSQIKYTLKTLRGRARNLALNNPTIKGYLSLLKSNVVGRNGIALRVQAKDPSGELDTIGNGLIQSAWNDFCMYPTVDNQYSMVDVQNICVESRARDGEVLIRIIRDRTFKFGLKLQVLEADHLDETYYSSYNGNEIRASIEYDKYNKPVAYWILQNHPGTDTVKTNKRIRLNNNELIHFYKKTRPSISRGVPDVSNCIDTINHLEGLLEAELINSRIEAARQGFITLTGTEQQYDGKSQQQQIVLDSKPGEYQVLPPNMDIVQPNPLHPNTNVAEIAKIYYRNIAASLGVSYASLTGDFSESNFSSSRMGYNNERDFFKSEQQLTIDTLMIPIYLYWLESAMLVGAINLPISKYDKFANAVTFIPRGWGYIQPLQDVNTAINKINNKLTSRSRECAENGLDFETIIREQAYESELLKQYGLMEIPKDKSKSGEQTTNG